MFQRKPTRFRRHNGRGHSPHRNGHSQSRPRSNSFSNGPTRNNFRPTQSAEKLLEKYSTLAKEAMSSGDKTLSENYLQHADHFMRVIEDKNKLREQNKINTTDKPIVEATNLTQGNEASEKDLPKNEK
jgi:hypothetical protein|tara:strand:+ start:454 stop:837 length:384 start_codon:yes stop_codon:yes gene_type:complete